jgi:DNA repair protein RadA/Sms
MSSFKLIYVCQSCGYKNPKWLGKCPDCSEFNSMVEEVEEAKKRRSSAPARVEPPTPINQIQFKEESRLKVGINEVDRVFGGGVVDGSVNLIGGEPGIGKSTLLLQVSNKIASNGNKVLYITAEESLLQTKLRASRLGITSDNLLIASETNCDVIQKYLEEIKPALAVIDSIQMVHKPELPSAAGTVSQVRQCAADISATAKQLGVSVFLIGHVTKEGGLAGPKTLEHIVDAVFFFEGDRFQAFRILRSAKNRFGSTNEVGIFEMLSTGLAEVENPSYHLMTQERKGRVGSCVVSSFVGTRALLVEVQALTTKTSFGVPTRRVSGVDFNRVAMILAVLERHCGLHVGTHDAYVNAVGGVQIEEPACDLAIAMAISSSFRNIPISPKILAVGELGLGGEVRAVTQINPRLQEASRLGFERLIVPQDNLKAIQQTSNVTTIGVGHIQAVFEKIGL